MPYLVWLCSGVEERHIHRNIWFGSAQVLKTEISTGIPGLALLNLWRQTSQQTYLGWLYSVIYENTDTSKDTLNLALFSLWRHLSTGIPDFPWLFFVPTGDRFLDLSWLTPVRCLSLSNSISHASGVCDRCAKWLTCFRTLWQMGQLVNMFQDFVTDVPISWQVSGLYDRCADWLTCFRTLWQTCQLANMFQDCGRCANWLTCFRTLWQAC